MQVRPLIAVACASLRPSLLRVLLLREKVINAAREREMALPQAAPYGRAPGKEQACDFPIARLLSTSPQLLSTREKPWKAIKWAGCKA